MFRVRDSMWINILLPACGMAVTCHCTALNSYFTITVEYDWKRLYITNKGDEWCSKQVSHFLPPLEEGSVWAIVGVQTDSDPRNSVFFFMGSIGEDSPRKEGRLWNLVHHLSTGLHKCQAKDTNWSMEAVVSVGRGHSKWWKLPSVGGTWTDVKGY